ncbi:MAG TPA: PTS sugar transporter subunit IIA [Casimicrobiaceae bacterium]|nr:PTS sugar transporter subunit IIA [Casimicrobiaceae bacterium]
MTNPVVAVMGSGDIAFDVEMATRAELFDRLAAMLAHGSRPTRAEVVAGLSAREELGSTAVGYGIAIPHARMPQCAAPAAALVRLRTGIPFGAPDGKPVSLFLGLIVPQDANQQHLKLLATAAAMFSDRGVREGLRVARDPATAMELLAAWPGVRPPQ